MKCWVGLVCAVRCNEQGEFSLSNVLPACLPAYLQSDRSKQKSNANPKLFQSVGLLEEKKGGGVVVPIQKWPKRERKKIERIGIRGSSVVVHAKLKSHGCIKLDYFFFPFFLFSFFFLPLSIVQLIPLDLFSTTLIYY